MFDSLTKSKFYIKCKTAIKLTKTRMEMIRKKRSSMVKYLKKDIADLLKNGLDINAYGRAEGLLVEMNVSSSYDLVEQFRECISNHLSMIDSQRECPEECREAVSSLTIAAARFADLPELRDLRSIFTDRYGNSLECYANQEFVGKLKAVPPTKEMKLQLLQDVALEAGIVWDSKALDQKLYKPPSSEQDLSKNADDDKHKLHKSRDESDWKIDNHDAGNRHRSRREHTAPRRNMEDHDGYELHKHRENAVPKREDHGHPSRERPENAPSKDIQLASVERSEQQTTSNLVNGAPEDKVEEKQPFYYRLIPPPYRSRQKDDKNETVSEAPPAASPSREAMEPKKLNQHVDGKENPDKDDLVKANRKPRSVRRQRTGLKPQPGHENADKVDGDGKTHSNGAKQDAKGGLKTFSEDEDEEERRMDDLLKQYSAKQSPYEHGAVEAALKRTPSHYAAAATRNKSKDGPHSRVASLPLQPTSPTHEKTEGHARASSFQPDMGHEQPKLLDYDDFLARFAALKEK